MRPLWALALLAIGCGGASVATRPSVHPVSLADGAEERRIELLGGHVTISVPASWSGEVEEARVAGAVVESRIALEPSSSDALFAFPRLQMTITELHARTSGDVMADAREVFADDWQLDPEPDPSRRIAWVLGDAREWNGEVPFVVLGALVVHEDRSLQRVMLRVAADVPASERPAFARRARHIVLSMRAGTQLSTSAATHRIGDRLMIDIPDGYRFTCDEMPTGRASCGIRHVRSMGSPSHGLLTFRLTPTGQIQLPPPSDATEVQHTVLGRAIPWHLSRGDELILRTSVPHGDLRLEIVIASHDEAGERALLSIVRSLRLGE